MTWGHVKYAVRRAATAFLSLAREANAPPTGRHGRAQRTEPKLKRNGASTLNLEARAMRVCNRSKKARQKYVETHKALAKGNCYD